MDSVDCPCSAQVQETECQSERQGAGAAWGMPAAMLLGSNIIHGLGVLHFWAMLILTGWIGGTLRNDPPPVCLRGLETWRDVSRILSRSHERREFCTQVFQFLIQKLLCFYSLLLFVSGRRDTPLTHVFPGCIEAWNAYLEWKSNAGDLTPLGDSSATQLTAGKETRDPNGTSSSWAHPSLQRSMW